MPNAPRPLIAKCSIAALAFCAASLPAAAAPDANAPAAAGVTVPAPLTAPQVVQLMDQTIDWYRTLGIQQQTANEPSDLLILYDNRQAAGRIVSLAVEFARADADILSRQPDAANGTSAASMQPLVQLQDKFNSQTTTTQAALSAAQRRLANSRGNAAFELKAKISELQGELDLLQSRKDLLSTLLTISSDSDANGISASSLKSQIDAMVIAQSSAGSAALQTGAPQTGAPQTGASAASAAGAMQGIGAVAAAALAPTAASGLNPAARFGIWDLAADAFRLSEKIVTIDDLDKRTAALQSAFASIRDPLVEQLRALSGRGDALATRADSADAATLTQMRTQLDALAAQIKQDSGLLIPLGKQAVLLAQYRRNLANWRSIIESQYAKSLRTLGIRVTVLIALLAVVFSAAEFWRRAVMHYIRDTRRRYQLLLLRKIALWTLTVVIIGFAFSSELGSVVTFAGLITAGLAVAMQSVLVSIVGYFFLIGKYGVRIGDRVQFGDVVGEVIELGLVRMYLLELGAHGQLGPTGRVVAFANSIVFQVSSGLFKQIPGVDFAWHEMTLSLPAGIDYGAAKDALSTAVAAALKDSDEEITRQTLEIQRTAASGSAADFQARVQLNFTPTGVEARIRYPVHSSEAAAIDDRVSRELITVLEGLSARPAATSKP